MPHNILYNTRVNRGMQHEGIVTRARELESHTDRGLDSPLPGMRVV